MKFPFTSIGMMFVVMSMCVLPSLACPLMLRAKGVKVRGPPCMEARTNQLLKNLNINDGKKSSGENSNTGLQARWAVDEAGLRKVGV